MDGGGEIAGWLAEVWTARLSETLENMTAARPLVDVRAASGAAAGDVLWWEQPLSLGPQALVWVGAPEASWLELGNYTLRSAGIEPSDAADARNTYLELLSQTLGGVAQAIGARLGAPVTCEGGREGNLPESAPFEAQVTLGEAVCSLFLGCSPGLLAACGASNVAGAPADLAKTSVQAPAEAAAAPTAEPLPSSKTLDLLMDVELPVSVSFGRAQLPLKDVLKLTTGSIVELNRAISEPVEIIINNCVIARGEVVVVEGNYGVRIQEVVSRDKRLRMVK